MSRNSSPILEKTIAFVESMLHDETVIGDGILPTIKHCASLADVSQVTMWKAIHVLKQRGFLSGKYGGTLYVVGSDAWKKAQRKKSKQATLTHRSWERIRNTIERDIYDGILKPNERIPLLKQLQHKYKASFETVKRALEMLHEERLIEPHGRGYVVSSIRAKKKTTRIVLLGQKNRNGVLSLCANGIELFRALESECIKCNVGLDVVVYDQSQENTAFFYDGSSQPYNFSIAEDILGILFLDIEIDSRYNEIIRFLSHIRVPVAVITHKQNAIIPRDIRQPHLFRLFLLGTDEQPGKKIGRFLCECGYTAIAYISPFHGTEWSQKRCGGLVQVCTSSQREIRVFPFVSEGYIDSSYHPDFPLDPVIRKHFSSYLDWRKSIDQVFYHCLDDPVKTSLVQGMLCKYLVPLFEQALKNTSIHAWVCANDFVSEQALWFLQETDILRQRCAPTLISFDNTEIAIRNRITSYDINFSVIVQHLLNFILRRDNTFQRKYRRPVKVDGVIIDRSVGRHHQSQ